jgi:predicted ArsR family transcriptional regulator
MKIPQKQRIINYIREFGSITSFEAYSDLGITQMGARIDQLQKEGYVFKTEWIAGKNRYGEPSNYKRYYLADMVTENMQHIPQV